MREQLTILLGHLFKVGSRNFDPEIGRKVTVILGYFMAIKRRNIVRYVILADFTRTFLRLNFLGISFIERCASTANKVPQHCFLSERHYYASFSTKSTSRPSERSSFVITWNDSGMPDSKLWSPRTIDSYTLLRPATSSDFTVSISCSV